MRTQTEKYKRENQNTSIVASEGVEGTQCNDCEINFKSEYHLETHMKTSQHVIQSGLNRKFSYKLNQKNAKKKLLQGASKNPYVKEQKSTCVVLTFNDGSYFYSVLPLIEDWKMRKASGENIVGDNHEIRVTEVKSGKEEGGMCVDVLLKFEINNSKVAVHCYNTKQKMLVNGSGYSRFVEKYLEPHLKQKIEAQLMQIQNFNTLVTDTFGSTKRKNVKYRPGSKSADDSIDLKAHKRKKHANEGLVVSSIIELNKISTSTRDNSVSDLLNEDISAIELLDDSEETDTAGDMEESIKIKKFHCYMCQAGFVEESELTEHEQKEHHQQLLADNQKQVEKPESNSTCEKCPFQSSDNGDLVNHVQKEHTVQVRYWDFKAQCHLCKFETKDPTAMDDHVVKEHGFVCCNKCEYIAADKSLLKQHKMKHTGTSIYTCGTCEFETTRQAMLNDHIEAKHMKKNFWWLEKEKSEYNCDKCEKKFQNLFVMRYHLCVQKTKYACSFCEVIVETFEELVPHLETEHTKKSIRCELCPFEATNMEDIGSHVQVKHKTTQVKISKEEQVVLMCDQCEYRCNLNIKLKKHKMVHQKEKETDLIYECDVCDLTFDFLTQALEHRQTKHSDLEPDLSPKPKDMAMSLLIEQNVELQRELERFKKDVKNAFTEFASNMKECFEAVGEDIKESRKQNLRGFSDISEVFGAKLEKIENKIDNHIEKSNIGQRDTKKDVESEHDKTENYNKNMHTEESKTKTEIKNKSKKKSSKKKIKWIGTSDGSVLNKEKVENTLNVDLSMERAYYIDEEESAPLKENNFKTVISEKIKHEEIDVLVLQTGSIEITDLKVNEAILDTKKDLTEYKKDWFKKVENDSAKVFDVALDALSKNNGIEKVVIVKRLPRYDRSSSDILKIKSELSEFANRAYDQIWQKMGSPENIQIVDIDLKCSSSAHLRNLIFGHSDSENFDGIHMRGEGASRHFTYRTINALKQVIFSEKRKETYRNKSRAYTQAKSVPDDDHSACPQTVYQMWKKVEKNLHHKIPPAKSYRPRFNDNRYSVPTQNRFSPLN